jgi:hypothetical protein
MVKTYNCFDIKLNSAKFKFGRSELNTVGNTVCTFVRLYIAIALLMV